MKLEIFLVVLACIPALFLACSANDPQTESSQANEAESADIHSDFAEDSDHEQEALRPLPRGVSPYLLDDLFDTEGENVHTFGNADGSLDYVYNDVENDRPINVDIDEDGFITRLSWHFLVEGPDGLKEAMAEAKEKFGHHLTNEEVKDTATWMYFDDGLTLYTVNFEGNMVTLTVVESPSLSEGTEVS